MTDLAPRRTLTALLPTLIVLALLALTAAPARAADCAVADFAYNGACGPEFETPAWGDAAGWTDASKYSTIKLADVTGDGAPELLARNDQGIEIWTFDTGFGQWRPALDGDGDPQVLASFHSSMPQVDVRGSWKDPAAYMTFQTADVLGGAAQEIVSDDPVKGTQVWIYEAQSDNNGVPLPDGGTWLNFSSTGGILPPSPPPADYASYTALDGLPSAGIPAALLVGSSYWTYEGSAGYQATGKTSLAPASNDPRYYLNSLPARMPYYASPGATPTLAPANLFRTPDGLGIQRFDGQNWSYLQQPQADGSPLSDNACAGPCFGSDPSYYETLRTANNLLGPADTNGYVLGRLADGLHVYPVEAQEGSDWWDASVPVIGDLADSSAGAPPPAGEWGSIRTGDINGDGATDVLARVDGQLQAWTLSQDAASGAWTWAKLPVAAGLELDLGGDAWDTDPAYYSTLQVGPVAGAGTRDGVIARGPFGVRTWFYDLNGSGGWTSYMPTDPSSYPQFTGDAMNAYNGLNFELPSNIIGNGKIRDLYTGQTGPADTDTLSAAVVLAGKCTGKTTALPPQYASCQPPSLNAGYTAAEFTTVVNQILSEISAVGQANQFFGALDTLNASMFLSQSAELPAVADSVAALGASAGNNTSNISGLAVFSTGVGIIGTIAGELAEDTDPPIAAALGVLSYIAGIIPSATPAVTQPPFPGTLNALADDLADAITQASAAIDAQHLEVRQNYGMLQLLAMMTAPSAPWATLQDSDGLLLGTMNQGYALWAYKQLLPTMLEQDSITGCVNGFGEGGNGKCSWTPWIGSISSDPSAFQTLNTPHSVGQLMQNSIPCSALFGATCSFSTPPTGTVNGQPGSDIATKVWGPISPSCASNGSVYTAWSFGCNLGIEPALSVDSVGGPANGWLFTLCTADPLLMFASDSSGGGTCSAETSATADTGSAGSLTLRANVRLPAGFRVRSATLAAGRVLREPAGRGELVRRRSGKALGTVRLDTATGTARAATLKDARGGPKATLHVRRTGRTHQAITLKLRGVRVADPHACRALPATLTREDRPFTLKSQIALSNGRRSHTVSIPAHWTCVREPGRDVGGLKTVAPPEPAQHPGLQVTMAGPRTVVPGSQAMVTVRVRNTRRGAARSPLANVSVQVGLARPAGWPPRGVESRAPAVRRISRVRPGRTVTLRVPVHVPAGVAGTSVRRLCVAASATADSTRPDGARTCAPLGAGPSGLG